jgi:raffinose/stachyose/melibiose transport system substrate-binding protein
MGKISSQLFSRRIKKMKKMLLMVVMLFLTAAIAFSGGQSGGKTEAVTLDFWYGVWWEGQWYEQVRDAFYEKYPNIRINGTGYGDPAILDALYVASASKTGPDAYFLWFGWQQWPLVEAGFTLDLTEYNKQYRWDQKINKGALDLATQEGKLWGVPFAQLSMVLWARKDLLDKYNAGKIPGSMAELRAYGDKLKEQNIALAASASVDGWQLLRYTQMIIESHVGVPYMDKLYALDKASTWDSPEVVAALRELKLWGDKYFQKGFLGTKPNETKVPWYNGEAAIEFQGPWYEEGMETDGQDFEVVIFPFPVDSQPVRLDSFIEQVAVTASSEHKDEAVKLADFWSDVETHNRFADIIPYTSAAVDFEVPDSKPLSKKIAEWQSQMPATPPWDGGLPMEFANVVYEVQDSVCNGSMTPEQGAKHMQEWWDNFLKTR